MLPCFIWCGANSGDHPKMDLALMATKLLENSPKL
jgi:hypothetical protein